MRTILYAQAAHTGQTIAHQCERAEAAGFRLDDVVADEVGASAQAPLAARPEGKRLLASLRAGDVLVVDRVDRLGRTYAELSDAIRRLMERGVVIRTLIDELTFDGGAQTPMQQAARDALIAFAAAQAQVDATRDAYKIRQAMIRESDSRWDAMFSRETARLQARISFALIAAMAAGVYVIGFVLPVSPPHPSPMAQMEQATPSPPRLEAEREPPSEPARSAQHGRDQGSTVLAQNEARTDAAPAQSDLRRDADEPASRPPARSETPRGDEGGSAEGRLAPPSASPAEPTPEPARPASPEKPQTGEWPGVEEKKVRETVIEWRSARVHRPDFSVSVGNTVPRHIHLATFPRRLVAQMPRYRGYKFIVADNQVAVVDPGTYRIVAVIGE